jgi:general secretion pathway protein L
VFSSFRALGRAFFGWWFGELAKFVPALLRHRLDRLGQRGSLVLALGPAEVELTVEQGDRVRRLAIVDPASAAARQELAAALGRGAFSWRKPFVCLRLPAGIALRNIIAVPLAAEPNIREVVSYELDRHTPFAAQDVHFAPRVVGRDTAAQRLRVELTIISRATVDSALTAVRNLGFNPDRVEIGGSGPAEPSSPLVLDDEKPVTRRFGRGLNIALAAAVLILAAIAVYLPYQTDEIRTARIETTLAEVKTKTVELKRITGEIAALREDGTFLINRKRRAPNVSEILAAITTVMPDETWLVEFQLSAAELQLAGFSASASNLIGFLEHTPIFRNTAFRSPVTQDPASQRERFHIAARVVSESEK